MLKKLKIWSYLLPEGYVHNKVS